MHVFPNLAAQPPLEQRCVQVDLELLFKLLQGVCVGMRNCPKRVPIATPRHFPHVTSLDLEDCKWRFEGVAGSKGGQRRQQLFRMLESLPSLQRLANGLNSQLSPSDALVLADHALPKLVCLKVRCTRSAG